MYAVMLFAENEQKVFAFPKLVQEASGKVSICDVKKEGNQVVLVDDGSGEDKQQEFWKLSEYAIVLHHEQNRGKGTAIKTALKFIQESLWDYDVVGIMDGDGQHQVQDSDTQSGLRAFSSEMNREFCEVSGERYEYETEVLLYCVKQKIPIVEVPIETIYRDKENSTSHFRVIRDSFRIYKEFIKE